jgi:hypothetical protein
MRRAESAAALWLTFPHSRRCPQWGIYTRRVGRRNGLRNVRTPMHAWSTFPPAPSPTPTAMTRPCLTVVSATLYTLTNLRSHDPTKRQLDPIILPPHRHHASCLSQPMRTTSTHSIVDLRPLETRSTQTGPAETRFALETRQVIWSLDRSEGKFRVAVVPIPIPNPGRRGSCSRDLSIEAS